MPWSRPESHGERLRALSLAGQRLTDKRWSDCHFENCVFEEIVWSECAWLDCTFTDCAFMLGEWDRLNIKDTVFERCKLVGLALGGDSIAKNPLTRLSFRDCKLQNCTLMNLELDDLSLHHCRLAECMIQECRLPRLDCNRAVFDNTTIARCDLQGADFRGAEGILIDPRQNALAGARFSAHNALDLLAPFGIEIE